MQKAFVIDAKKKPLNPCNYRQARTLLNDKKAKVFRRYPFTLILNEECSVADNREYVLKIRPGSKQTGFCLTHTLNGKLFVDFAAELEHKSFEVKSSLESRAATRRGRRNRNCRYRPARFMNRKKEKGWLPPSLMSRVDNVTSFVKKLLTVAPIKSIDVETSKFDTQKMQNPEISGIEYQQGELFGYEIREYLLEKFQRQCFYCDKKNVKLHIEHVIPKSKGGSHRVSNLTLACDPCGKRKADKTVEEFLKKKPAKLRKLKTQLKQPLKDVAAINATRYEIIRQLEAFEIPVNIYYGYRTKRNRIKANLEKNTLSDTLSVGIVDDMYVEDAHPILNIKAVGRGKRQMCKINKYGYPCSAGKDKKKRKDFGVMTGDIIRFTNLKGSNVGTFTGRAVSCSKSVYIKKKVEGKPKMITVTKSAEVKILQKADGYNYTQSSLSMKDTNSTDTVVIKQSIK